MDSAKGPSERQVATWVSILVGGATAGLTILTFWLIYWLALGVTVEETLAATDAPYDYNAGIQSIINAEPNVPGENDPRSPWLGSEAWTTAIQAGNEYIVQYPQPQNIQVLTGMDTAQIWAYMQRMSGALGVSCQYCHDINNFASYAYLQKNSGLLMLQLVQDLNAQYVNNLPNWRGNYVQCDTCHYGEVVGLPAVSETFLGGTPPIDVYLEPLNDQGVPQRDPSLHMSLEEATLYYLYNYQIWQPYSPDDLDSGRGSLALTYEGGRTQDQVTINQNTMNLMGWSLGVGCTYCHNARNFYAYEADMVSPQFVPTYAVNRLKTQRMLLMTTFMANNWSNYVLPRADLQPDENGVSPVSMPLDGQQYYVTIDGVTYAVPGCYTCHRANVVPNAAINMVDIEEQGGVVAFPSTLKGLGGQE